jgi:hypothetical protein
MAVTRSGEARPEEGILAPVGTVRATVVALLVLAHCALAGGPPVCREQLDRLFPLPASPPIRWKGLQLVAFEHCREAATLRNAGANDDQLERLRATFAGKNLVSEILGVWPASFRGQSKEDVEDLRCRLAVAYHWLRDVEGWDVGEHALQNRGFTAESLEASLTRYERVVSLGTGPVAVMAMNSVHSLFANGLRQAQVRPARSVASGTSWLGLALFLVLGAGAAWVRRPRARAAPAAPGDSVPTTQLPAHLQNIVQIGRGGMGIVYRAYDAHAAREVAVKVLNMGTTGDTEALRRFAREVKILGQLAHPNIVRLFDSGLSPVPHFVMEYFPGKSLRNLLEAGPLPVSQLMDILQQVANALHAAHESGIVHRDIKPENILTNAADLVKVVDFGVSSMANATVLTRSGQGVGTPRYASPELLDGAPTTAASDIYALGLVAIEALTGRPAFGDGELASRLVKSPQRLPDDPQLGGDLADLIQKCVQVAPHERPTAATVASELERLSRTQSSSAGS